MCRSQEENTMPRIDTTRIKQFFTRKKPVAVPRSAQRYIVEQGWTHTNGATFPEWHGYYRTRFGSNAGRIEMSHHPKFYLHNPPEGLTTRHDHSACFNLYPVLGEKWYSVHWYIQPQDIDSGVMELERILREGYLLTKQTA
jgi:hypothetical protein